VAILVGILIAIALVIQLSATVFTDLKMWGIFREQRQAFRKLPRERRRSIHIRMTIMSVVVWGYAALLFAAPLGRRDTFLYLLIIPFLILVPLGTIAAGVYGARGGHRRGSGDSQGDRSPSPQ
jgi:hypothetical protein